jgi:hypothetical protein
MACLIIGQPVLLISLDSEGKLLKLHSPVVYWTFPFTNATRLTEQLIQLVDGHFHWWFPIRLHMKSTLRSNHRFKIRHCSVILDLCTRGNIFHTFDLRWQDLVTKNVITLHTCIGLVFLPVLFAT